MRKKEEILKALQGIKLCLMAHPDNEENSEFEIRINQIEEIEESIPKYADEFACAFAEWNKEKAPMGLYNDGTCIKPKTLTELLEIFKKEQDGL